MLSCNRDRGQIVTLVMCTGDGDDGELKPAAMSLLFSGHSFFRKCLQCHSCIISKLSCRSMQFQCNIILSGRQETMEVTFVPLTLLFFETVAGGVHWPEHVICSSPHLQLSYVSCGEQISSFCLYCTVHGFRLCYRTENITKITVLLF